MVVSGYQYWELNFNWSIKSELYGQEWYERLKQSFPFINPFVFSIIKQLIILCKPYYLKSYAQLFYALKDVVWSDHTNYD